MNSTSTQLLQNVSASECSAAHYQHLGSAVASCLSPVACPTQSVQDPSKQAIHTLQALTATDAVTAEVQSPQSFARLQAPADAPNLVSCQQQLLQVAVLGEVPDLSNAVVGKSCLAQVAAACSAAATVAAICC